MRNCVKALSHGSPDSCASDKVEMKLLSGAVTREERHHCFRPHLHDNSQQEAASVCLFLCPKWAKVTSASKVSWPDFKRSLRDSRKNSCIKALMSSKRFHILHFSQGLHALPHQTVKMIRAACSDQNFHCISFILRRPVFCLTMDVSISPGDC